MTVHQSQRKVSAMAQLDAAWEATGLMVLDVPMVSLYGDVVSVTEMSAREQIMVWMTLLDEIEEKICALEDASGLDRDEVVNVFSWRLTRIDPDEGLDIAE